VQPGLGLVPGRLAAIVNSPAETGPTGQLHYGSMANGGHLFHPEDKDKLDFSELAKLFYAQESTT